MTRHIFPGIRPEPLASYLAGLGLIRVLGERPDPELRAWWDDSGLALETTVGDVSAWLAEEYIPTPVLSPWNEGSGFGAKDKAPRAALEAILSNPSPRLEPFRQAIEVAQYVGAMYRSGWTKERAVLEFRNRCTERLLPWLDAAVVLAGSQVYFPPLLGTGGNDGRLDFSTNYHQRLLELLTTDQAEARLALARDLLAGAQTQQLSPAAVGQFDPGAAGGRNSSPFGAAEPMVNPWLYVLLVEGALLFASTAARRNQHGVGRAAMPFTVLGSAEGSSTGARRESSRGELWAPVWQTPFSPAEICQLFSEARAAWRGKPARQAIEFYAATRTLGVARGVSSFSRYGLHQRNGLAFTAVPIERVRVTIRPEVTLAAQVEEWVSWVRRSDASTSVEEEVRRFDLAYYEFAKDGGALGLGRLLAAVTGIELAAGRSARAREAVPARRPPRAGDFLSRMLDDESPELRVAAGIASICTRGSSVSPSRSMRQILLPIDPGGAKPEWRKAPLVTGLGLRAVRPVLADVLAWRARVSAVEEPEVDSSRRALGVLGFRIGVAVPDADLHAFATPGALDEKLVEVWLMACLALEWRQVSHTWSDPGRPNLPIPLLGMLHPFAAGLAASGHGPDALRLGLEPDWPARLAAGQTWEVQADAARRLRRAGLRVAETAWAAGSAVGPGTGVPRQRTTTPAAADIAAALVPRCARPYRVLHRFLACPLKPVDKVEDKPLLIDETKLHNDTELEMS